MKNLLHVWAKCLGLVIFIPLLVLLLPFVAAIDCCLDGQPYRDRIGHYYRLLSRLEVSITPRW